MKHGMYFTQKYVGFTFCANKLLIRKKGNSNESNKIKK